MDKKKIAGLIIFTLLIGGILVYPSIMERADGHIYKFKVQSALKSGDYHRVRNLILNNGSVDGFGWDFFALLDSEINLGNDLTHYINRLEMHGKIDILQYIVDNLGDDLHKYIKLFTIEGLVIDEQLRYNIANMQIMVPPYHFFYNDALNMALKIRGPRETIDNIYLRYLIHKGEIEEALRLYNEMDEKYKMDVLDALMPTLVFKTFYTEGFGPATHEELLANIDRLSRLELSDEMFRHFLKEAMVLKSLDIYLQETIDKYPYFTENLYYKYYSNLRKLRNYGAYNHGNTSYQELLDDVINNLKKDEFKEIPEVQEVLTVLKESTRVFSFLNVNKNGSILYYTGNMEKGSFNIYNTRTKQQSKFSFGDRLASETVSYDSLQFSLSSVGRNYYLALGVSFEEAPEEWQRTAKFRHLLLDSDFNLIDATEFSNSPESREWLEIITNIVGNSKFFNPFAFNTEPRTTSFVNEDEAAFLLNFEVPGTKNYHLYHIDDEIYAIIQYKHDINNLGVFYTYYSVFDLKTHKLLYQVDLRQFDGLLGSCHQYLYVANIIEGTFVTLEMVDKKTMEMTRLPFYSIETGDSRYWSITKSKFYSNSFYFGVGLH